LAANANASSFASKIPTVTEPINDGVLNLQQSGVFIPPFVMLWPILLGSDNDVSSMRLLGWNKVLLDTKTDLWFPTLIGEWACTACGAVGIAAAAVLNTERFCDTITPVAAHTRDKVIAAGTAINSDFEVESPVGDVIGHIVAPIFGFQKIEFTFDQTTGTPTQNVLYQFLIEVDC
jgi:hypothetical protein